MKPALLGLLALTLSGCGGGSLSGFSQLEVDSAVEGAVCFRDGTFVCSEGPNSPVLECRLGTWTFWGTCEVGARGSCKRAVGCVKAEGSP